MVTYSLVFSKQAKKDAQKIKQAGLKKKTEELLTILKKDPYQNPPRYEKLVGNLTGAYSRRINIQRRLVYEVAEDESIVKVLRMWTHYE